MTSPKLPPELATLFPLEFSCAGEWHDAPCSGHPMPASSVRPGHRQAEPLPVGRGSKFAERLDDAAPCFGRRETTRGPATRGERLVLASRATRGVALEATVRLHEAIVQAAVRRGETDAPAEARQGDKKVGLQHGCAIRGRRYGGGCRPVWQNHTHFADQPGDIRNRDPRERSDRAQTRESGQERPAWKPRSSRFH